MPTNYHKTHFGKDIERMSKAETDFLELTAKQEYERLLKKYKGQHSLLVALGLLLSQTRKADASHE